MPESTKSVNQVCQFNDKSKSESVRNGNIQAAKAVADAVRTSLGPKGMDKMIQDGEKGDVTITNDGATILKLMKLLHPAAKMMVDLSKSQDVQAGDGTTTVVVIAGNLLDACDQLLKRGIHPTTISEGFAMASQKVSEILEGMSTPVDLSKKEQLIQMASTALNSKVVNQYSSVLAPLAVESVLRVMEDGKVNFKNIKILQKLGGTVEDTMMLPEGGLLLDRRVEPLCKTGKVENARIALIQFCLSAPKTDMDHGVVISDYTQMDRIMREERNYILKLIKSVKAAGVNVLLIQKSILRDAVSDIALHYCSKLGIMVVKDIERDEIEFICRSISCKPIASPDHLQDEMLAKAELVEEVHVGSSRVVRFAGVEKAGRTVSIQVRGINKLVLEEAERSLHDAQCVVRCLVSKPALIAGGGAPEIEAALRLTEHAHTVSGIEQYCLQAFASSLEVIPYTLAENAGLNPMRLVTELRARHRAGEQNAGINVRRGCAVSDIANCAEKVMQPLLVTQSAISLATETVRAILKIDDVIACIR